MKQRVFQVYILILGKLLPLLIKLKLVFCIFYLLFPFALLSKERSYTALLTLIK